MSFPSCPSSLNYHSCMGRKFSPGLMSRKDNSRCGTHVFRYWRDTHIHVFALHFLQIKANWCLVQVIAPSIYGMFKQELFCRSCATAILFFHWHTHPMG